ncbi:MAG: SMODS domain-containing nucleotidyltransferase, partial [Byssovorax sp.]
MTTVREAFQKFVSNLELTQPERDNVSQQQNVVRANLRSHLGGIERDILSGSYSRGTSIRPLNDIDVFIILEEATHGALRGQQPTACL